MKKKRFNEGALVTGLGTIVTGVGSSMFTKRKLKPWAAGVTGFGIAHIILGGLDIYKNKR